MSKTLFPLELQSCADDWTFNGVRTREITHCYHDYPARMIPQVAGKLLDRFGKKAHFLFDPYCGTGTSLVEGAVRGIDVAGTDLNPLARLIATAKTTYVSPQAVRSAIDAFHRFPLANRADEIVPATHVAGITNLAFWFKPTVVRALTALSEYIGTIDNPKVKRFFQVAFSETVRESSNTRNEEFKLYRYSPDKLKTFNPDVSRIMAEKLERNYKGLLGFAKIVGALPQRPKADIFDFNTVDEIPEAKIPAGSVDIVITSPPYGDSHTTVAYGQYSRLSAAWLGLPEPHSIDSKLMGGRTQKQIHTFPCDELNDALQRIASSHLARAREVSAFYLDLECSIRNVSACMRRGGHVCYVVGNRIVKNVQLPTDSVIRSFFESNGLTHVATFNRSIPNKRMPERNSPSNVAGAVVSTMVREYIVVMTR